MNPDRVRAHRSSSGSAWQIISFPAVVDINNTVRIAARLFAACRPNAGLVVADLSQTGLVDTFGVRCLLVAADQALVCGAELRIVVRSPAVVRVLELAGVDGRFRIYPTIEGALADSAAALQDSDYQKTSRPAIARSPT